MREILFRAKTLDEGEWVYGYYGRKGVDEKTYKHYICKPVFNQNGTTYNGEFYFEDIEVAPETVCQYTGLDDKHDNKIFEGDIIETDNGEHSAIGVVKYGEFRPNLFYETLEKRIKHKIKENLKGAFVENKKFNEQYMLTTGTKKYAKITGNKFENPELLEVEE